MTDLQAAVIALLLPVVLAGAAVALGTLFLLTLIDAMSDWF
jgi:hypothetical protein